MVSERILDISEAARRQPVLHVANRPLAHVCWHLFLADERVATCGCRGPNRINTQENASAGASSFLSASRCCCGWRWRYCLSTVVGFPVGMITVLAAVWCPVPVPLYKGVAAPPPRRPSVYVTQTHREHPTILLGDGARAACGRVWRGGAARVPPRLRGAA